MAEHLGLERRERRLITIMRRPCRTVLRTRVRLWLDMSTTRKQSTNSNIWQANPYAMTARRRSAVRPFLSAPPGRTKWVKGQFLPALGLPPARSSPRRSFGSAHPGVEEFERAITSSRYVLLVLSPAYASDEWSVYAELLTSHAAVESGAQRLIPLLLQDYDLPLRVDFRVQLDCREASRWEARRSRGFATCWQRPLPHRNEFLHPIGDAAVPGGAGQAFLPERDE